MILLWGLLEDPTFRSVYDCLERRNAKMTFVNHAAIDRSNLRLTTHPRMWYEFSTDEGPLDLAEVSAAYLRPYDYRDYREPIEPNEVPLLNQRAGMVHHIVGVWAESFKGTIINRPSGESSNFSKLHQATLIEAAGFRVPHSLVTNDPGEIRDFASEHGRIIYKSMSAIRSIVKEFCDFSMLADRRLGPVFFQEHIAGENVRVHVVGNTTVACRIRSDGVDYRYSPATIEPFDLPDDVTARCIAVTRNLGLMLSGIDLIVTPKSEYYCLEVNPNPAFSYFDVLGDHGIARAVADTLCDGFPAPSAYA